MTEGETDISLKKYCDILTVSVLSYFKAWQDLCKKVPVQLLHICKANAELQIVLKADSKFLKKNKHITNDLIHVIKDGIEEKKRNIAIIIDDLHHLYNKIQRECADAIEQLTEAEDMSIDEVTRSSESTVSTGYLVERWSDVEQITDNEYVAKKLAVEFYMNDNNLEEEQIDNVMRDLTDFTELLQRISFLNKFI